MTDEDAEVDRIELAAAISSLARIVLGGNQSFEDVLQKLAQVTKRAIEGALEVSVTMHERRPVTAASTSEFARLVDDYQYDAGDGPCLEALRRGETIIVTNQSTETRWPEYSRQAREAGVRSSLSVPLLVEERHVAALNIYGEDVDVFGDESAKAAEELAVYAAVALNNADLYFTATSLADQLTEAINSRAVIEQAKGVIMGGRRCNEEEAFAILVKLSQTSHRKLRVVAQSIIDQIETTADARS